MRATEDRLTEDAGRKGQRARQSAAEPPRQASRPAPSPRQTRIDTEIDEERGVEAHEADDIVENPESFEEEDRMIQMFLDSMLDSVLPDLPDIPGHHTCWLSTSNPSDRISRRLAAGYKLITAKEFPHLDGASVKTGEYSGVIGVNEMLAAKIPERAYQRAMAVLHHERPHDEESKLRAKVDSVKESGERDGAPIVEIGDGTASLGKRMPAPRFF